eukprot:TRINITY_DN689_c0_g2_i1.p1 TRINITY_DN689_c0_g2~~TRINITY_DN689_c0_g2_i1.p1  ORF type:complete len:631 (+),score=238.70 TRINITY_DN689_c0_g2_i1:930-2822(+)
MNSSTTQTSSFSVSSGEFMHPPNDFVSRSVSLPGGQLNDHYGGTTSNTSFNNNNFHGTIAEGLDDNLVINNGQATDDVKPDDQQSDYLVNASRRLAGMNGTRRMVSTSPNLNLSGVRKLGQTPPNSPSISFKGIPPNSPSTEVSSVEEQQTYNNSNNNSNNNVSSKPVMANDFISNMSRHTMRSGITHNKKLSHFNDSIVGRSQSSPQLSHNKHPYHDDLGQIKQHHQYQQHQLKKDPLSDGSPETDNNNSNSNNNNTTVVYTEPSPVTTPSHSRSNSHHNFFNNVPHLRNTYLNTKKSDTNNNTIKEEEMPSATPSPLHDMSPLSPNNNNTNNNDIIDVNNNNVNKSPNSSPHYNPQQQQQQQQQQLQSPDDSMRSSSPIVNQMPVLVDPNQMINTKPSDDISNSRSRSMPPQRYTTTLQKFNEPTDEIMDESRSPYHQAANGTLSPPPEGGIMFNKTKRKQSQSQSVERNFKFYKNGQYGTQKAIPSSSSDNMNDVVDDLRAEVRELTSKLENAYLEITTLKNIVDDQRRSMQNFQREIDLKLQSLIKDQSYPYYQQDIPILQQPVVSHQPPPPQQYQEYQTHNFDTVPDSMVVCSDLGNAIQPTENTSNYFNLYNPIRETSSVMTHS